MSETSNMFRLNLADLAKGLVSAVGAAAVMSAWTVLAAVLGVDNFNAFEVDWAQVGRDMLNAAIIGAQGGFSGYLAKNFFTSKDGKLFGKISLR